jgi:hypothetical protein
LSATTAPALLDLLARLGFADYLGLVEGSEPALRLVQREAAATAAEVGMAQWPWRRQCAALINAWQEKRGALVTLSRQLGLTAPDLFILGLAAACERHRSIALALATLQAPVPVSRPTVHLTLELCTHLFEGSPGDALILAASPLVAQGVLALLGEDALPQRVLALRLPVWRALEEGPPVEGGTPPWPGGRRIEAGECEGISEAVLEHAVRAIQENEAGGVVLRGPPGSGRAALAATLAQRLGRAAIEVPLSQLRDDAGLATACRAAGWLPVVRLAPELGETSSLMRGGPVLPWVALAGVVGAVEGDRLIELNVDPPSPSRRAALWLQALGSAATDLGKDTLAVPVLYPSAIREIARAALIRAESAKRTVVPADLAAARQALAPDALRRLATPVTRRVTAEALVMSEPLAQDLAALISRCRQRESLWHGLGPSLAASTTRGVRALFAGDTGTGKTTAAAYVATVLGAPLYRCELGAVMNKYIGESEKNLGALLDHAEAADVVLLFDEADALFGRRTDGAETGERYANMLTNFLLTRIEAHNGVIILTVNGKTRIDPAFWRRLDQVIDFPVPGYPQRLALWRSHLGERAPADEVIEHLASYCDLAGGSIRNAVLAAAVMAAPAGPIAHADLLIALRREYAKLGRTLPASLAPVTRVA